MKKLISLLFLLIVFFFTSHAVAIPFQVGSGGTIDTSAIGLGVFDYTANPSGPFDLDEGQSTPLLNFFDVSFSAIAGGEVVVDIDFITPLADVEDSGDFFAFGTINRLLSIGYADVTWSDPVQFGYSYMGQTGGILELDLIDIHKGFAGHGTQTIAIEGSLTNIQSPDPVPEPATMLLFGTGLVGLSSFRWRKKKK